MKPPVIPDTLFHSLAHENESVFGPGLESLVLDVLNPYLNSTILGNIPRIREKTREPNPKSSKAFGAKPRIRKIQQHDGGGHYWYTYNYGGRAEMQFNVGMYKDMVTIGVGFEFGPEHQRGGNPSVVTSAYMEFQRVVDSRRDDFERFAKSNRIRAIEVPSVSSSPVTTAQVTSFIINYPYQRLTGPVEWLFVGRLLKRRIDKSILENPDKLDQVMKSVFEGLFPFWEEVQMRP